MANWTAEDFDFGDSSDTSNNEKYWRQKLGNQPVIKAPPPRSAWQRFVDSIDATIRHYSPVAAGARAVQRSIPLDKAYNETFGGPTPAQRRKRLVQEERDWREIDAQRDPADSVGDYVADFGGSLVGSMISDPTNLINPGSSFGRQVAAQLGIGAVSDAALQGAEMGEGVRDEYDPVQGVISAAAGPVLMGTVKGAKLGVDKINSGRRINAGRRMENFNDLVDTVVRLEGGGTLANPKTSSKGAKGPMQVMDATARDPGFGIRPWNGKTEADRARVGRQYLAALNHKYNGDTAKVLAAYNGGPGRVDAAVAKYGPEWLRAMPLESRNYVRNGVSKGGSKWAASDETFKDSPLELDKLFVNKKPESEEDLGPIQEALMRKAEEDSVGFVNDQPNTDDQAYANHWLSEDVEESPPSLTNLPSPEVVKMAKELYPQAKKIEDISPAEWAQAEKLANWKPKYLTAAEEYKQNLAQKNPALYGDEFKQADDALVKEADGLYDSGLYNSYEDAFKAAKNSTKFKDKYPDTEANKFEQKPFDPEDEDTWAIDDYDEPEYDFTYSEQPKPHYDYLSAQQEPFAKFYEDKGFPVDGTVLQAIYHVADSKGVHPYDIAEAVLNDDSAGGLNVKEIKDTVSKTVEQLEKQGYTAKPASESTSLYFPHKVGSSKEKPVKTTPSALAKAGATFLRMLKDNKGELSPSPDKFHEAITEWNKGTHYLLKGEDGTPLRIYHGTRHAYEGMPSGEKNRMPKGYVLYSTDPDFASNYANPRWANEPVTNARVFPAYVKNDRQIADFRKPEDLKKAIDWYKKRYGHALSWGTEHDLARGAWDQWERPEMLKDNGWKGAFLTEGMGDDKGPRLNIMLEDHLVMSILDPKTYKNKTIGHKIVNTLKKLIKDESGAYHMSENEIDPVEQKLIDAYKAAIPVSAEQRALDRQAKAEKAGQVDKLQQEQLGEVGYYAQLGALKGELPKADFESLRDNFAQEDIDHLLNKINMAPKLMPLEKVKAQQAMAKLLGLGDANFSRAPTAGDIKLLAQVFSPKLVQALEDKGFWAKAGRHVISGLNLPRALMSSMDVSAPFRQGINFVGKSEFWRAIPHMLKLFGSEKLSKESLNEIYSRPTWELMKRAGLAIQDPHSHLLADREEPFQTDWAESKIAKAMLVGHGVAASNRAYHGFLNKLRADVFDNFVKQYETIGINLATDDKKLKEIARFINSATGRGDMGKNLNAAAPVLAQAFFSPRLIASRLYMLSPHIYAKKDPILRKEAWKALFSYGAVAIAVAGLAKYGLGMDVEDDPRSSDFMKPKIGNTRYDIMGGFQQYITFAAKFITNSKITAAGEEQEFDPDKPFGSTRGSETIKFARNKASPLNSLFWDWATGKDPVGNDFNWTDAAKSRLFPMGTQDMADAYNEWGGKGIAMAAPTLGGIGVQTYEPKKPKSKDQDSLDNDFDSGFSSDDFDFGDF